MKEMITGFQDQDIYSDIHPFKDTAIWLKDKEKAADNYINANRIRSIFGEKLENNKFIAAQGPMDNTTENFWRMCLQERVGLIVTLVHSIGGSQGDCAEYFPRKVPIETTHDYGDISVTLL